MKSGGVSFQSDKNVLEVDTGEECVICEHP